MTLWVDLALEKADLLYRENPVCRLAIANRGPQTIRVPQLRTHPELPKFRLQNRKTGEERWSGGSASPRPGKEVELKPGQAIEHRFRAYDRVEPFPPGEHELSALFGDSCVDFAESKPVRIHVRPHSPVGIELDSRHGMAVYGAWRDSLSNWIVLSRFDLVRGGGVGDVLPVAPGKGRPVLSSGRRPWIAWMEGGTLKYVCVAGEKPKRGEMAIGEFEIIPPLSNDGVALLWNGSKFQTVALGEGRAIVTREWPGEGARWMRTQWLSDGRRSTLMVESSRGRIRLHRMDWTLESIGAPARLAEWPGALLAADGAVDSDDVIHGACLTRDRELIPWRLSRELAEGRRRRIAGVEPIVRAVIRVHRQGAPIVLFSDAEGKWTADLQGKQRSTALQGGVPFEIAFLYDAEPVLIRAEEGKGFQVVRLNGTPLPEESF